MTTNSTIRGLSAPQSAMLRRLCGGHEHVPGGTRTSGREAAAWSRTARSLQSRKLATLTYNGAGTGCATVTEFGRLVVSGRATLMRPRSDEAGQ